MTSLAPLQSAPNTRAVDPAIKRAADDFEAMFLTEMMNHMFSDVPVDETFGGGAGEQTFRGLLINEYGKSMVKAGGIGVSQMIQQEMIRLQEGVK